MPLTGKHLSRLINVKEISGTSKFKYHTTVPTQKINLQKLSNLLSHQLIFGIGDFEEAIKNPFGDALPNKQYAHGITKAFENIKM